MGGKSAPRAPNYRAAAEAQAASSRENTARQTWANRPNQTTPWGTVTWDANMGTDPATGLPITQWDQTLELTPQQQASLNSQFDLQQNRSGLASGLYGRLESEYANPVDWSSFTEYGGAPEARDFGGADRYVSDAEDAIYGRFESRAEPQFARDTAALDTQLRNQGLTPGTEAYDNQMRMLRESQNDARQQASYQATIGAGQEASRMLGMDLDTDRQRYSQGMASSNYQNQIRQQQIAEEMMRRGWTLNEVNAILTGQQVAQPNMPSFTNAGRSDTAQYLGAARAQGQADLDRFNAEQAGWQGALTGITDVGSYWFPGRG